jgi:hypothetical protein
MRGVCLRCVSMWCSLIGTAALEYSVVMYFTVSLSKGRDSSVGIATRYGPDDPGIES